MRLQPIYIMLKAVDGITIVEIFIGQTQVVFGKWYSIVWCNKQ